MQYLIITLLLILSSVVYLAIAKHYGIVDTPNHRSSHTQPIIRGGGILFYIALLIYIISQEAYDNLFFWGTTLITALSFIDDIKPLPAIVRFPVQMIAVIACLLEVQLALPIAILVFFVIAGVAFVNAFNFMDGINGITGFYGFTVVSSFLYITLFKTVFIDSQLLISVMLAILVFGFYNFRHKARFFAGDVGSISLAMILLYTGFLFFKETSSPIILALVAVYGIDSFMTILSRIKRREKLSEPHRLHIYQKVVDGKHLNHLQVAGIYALLQALTSSIAISSLSYAIFMQWGVTLGVLFLLGIVYVLAYKHLAKKETAS